MTINKRIKRIFIEHKATYIGIILLIFLSTSCFLGLKTAATSINTNVKDNRISANLEDANFTYSNKLTAEEMTNLEKKFDLELQENRQIEYLYNNATLRVLPALTEINKFSVYEGKTLQKDNDIMVDRYFFKAQKLSFGDTIKVGNKDFVICGIFTTPDYLSVFKSKTDFMCDGTKFGLCIVKDIAFNIIANGKETRSYSAIFHQNNTDNFRQELSKDGIVFEFTSRDANSRIKTFDGEIEALIMISKIAPMFILLVSSFIVAVVMGRMLKKEYIYIGTLTAMGYKKRQIVSHYLALPIIISIVGSIIGLISGFFLTGQFSVISSTEYNIPKPIYYYQWEDLLLLFLVPLILNSIAALFSILKAFNINTVALLKANTGKQKKGLLTRLIPHKFGSFKLRFKLKEITSNLSRSLVMLIGITAASLFILTGFLFDGSIKFLFDSNFHELFGYEYQYVLKQPLTGKSTTGEPFMISGFDYNKKGETLGVTLNGVANNSKYIKLYDDKGNVISQDKTVVSKSVAKRLELKKGDKITLKNNSNLKNYEITVDEICTIRYSTNVYLPLVKLNSMLGLPEDTHVGLYSNEKLNIDQKLVAKILTLKDSKAGLEVSIAAFKVFLYIMAFFAAVIGMIVIYIVTTMLIEENRKNISMLKVVGYHDKEISHLVINSTSVLVWIGYLLALPLTSVIVQAFFNTLTKNMFFAFSVRLEVWQGFVGFAFILGIYYITLFFTKRKVLNINMAESLKARE